MKFSWHTIGAGLLAVLSWATMYVNPAAFGHAAPIVGAVGTLVAAFSKPAVQRTGN